MTRRPTHSIHITKGNRGCPGARIVPTPPTRGGWLGLCRRGIPSCYKIESPAEAGPSVCMSVGLDVASDMLHNLGAVNSKGAVVVISGVKLHPLKSVERVPLAAGQADEDVSGEELRYGGGLCVVHTPKIGNFLSSPNK